MRLLRFLLAVTGLYALAVLVLSGAQRSEFIPLALTYGRIFGGVWLLIGLSLVKAAMIVAYFMHLRFERMSLVMTLVPTVVVCICLLFIVFPDGFRTRTIRNVTPSAEVSAGEPAAH